MDPLTSKVSSAKSRSFVLIGPAAVVGEGRSAEQRRLVGRRGRIVDHDQHPLALHVHALVVVPLQLGRDDAVANEDHIALHLDVRLLRARRRDDVREVLVARAGNTQHEAAIDHRLNDRHLLQRLKNRWLVDGDDGGSGLSQLRRRVHGIGVR